MKAAKPANTTAVTTPASWFLGMSASRPLTALIGALPTWTSVLRLFSSCLLRCGRASRRASALARRTQLRGHPLSPLGVRSCPPARTRAPDFREVAFSRRLLADAPAEDLSGFRRPGPCSARRVAARLCPRADNGLRCCCPRCIPCCRGALSPRAESSATDSFSHQLRSSDAGSICS
jgi:hypothetical protein